MTETNHNQVYSKSALSVDKQLPIIIGIIIFLIILMLFLPKVASKENDDSSFLSTSNGEVEIIESDDLLPNDQTNTFGIQSGNSVEELGADTVGDILGSESEAEEFYGHPNLDALLEGREIK